MTERLGRGPWARLLVSAVLPDEGSSLAERGRVLVEEEAVQDLVVTREPSRRASVRAR